MRLAYFLALTISLNAQIPLGSAWRGGLGGILGQQPNRVTSADLGRFEQYLGGAGAYCSGLTRADYAANHYMVQSMAAYVATMNTYSRDPQMRASLGRISGRISALPCAWTGYQPEPFVFDPSTVPIPSEPPFALAPPDVPKVATADKETFSDLQARYKVDATRAASAWKSSLVMRASLATQGATLNAETAAAVTRFQLLFGLAAGSMLDHRWDEVLEHLQAVEAETTKVAKVVGR